MWTYGGTYPGPTIERPARKDTKITFVDNLPSAVGPMTVHLHGDHHASADDGQPTTHLIRHGDERTYDFPLTDDGRPERASTFWYHDHAMGVTGRNVWHGLAGMFIVHDKHERRLPLPTGRYDLPLMVADRTFSETDENQLVDPFPTEPTMELTGPTAPPDDATVGQQVLVNGRFAPYKKVSTHRYRLRLVNGSNFTSYNFALSNGKPFHQIGTGNGLLPKPVLRSTILLGPAQRADVIVDFHGDLNKRINLESQARTDNTNGGVATPSVAIMQFRVASEAADDTEIPNSLQARPKLDVPNKIAHTWRFDVAGDKDTGSHWTINGKPFDPSRVDARVPLGSTQKWKLVNASPVTHYIHLHEERWRTVSRDGGPPKPWERGLEDTWKLDPGENVVVAAKFTDHLGSFMIHCHMLDHEDHGLMTQFKVVKPSSRTATASFRPPAPTPETTTAALSLGGPSLMPIFGSWPSVGRHALPSSREWMCGPKKKKASAEGRTDA
jgi:FtsP/CotA-like multicopper oxidase with cupredoxin domain